MKIDNDKYYTSVEVARECVELTFSCLPLDSVTEIIEPSAGNGVFLDAVKDYLCAHNKNIEVIGVDVIPERDDIIKSDFFCYPLGYKEGRLFIGNPPFGSRNSLSVRFYQKCVRYGDFVAFVQPISQLNNNIQLYEFDLVHSTDLGMTKYSDRELHCCFNVYKRPECGINDKPDYRLKDVTILEYRRKAGDAENKTIMDDYDYAMCNWGNGSLGRVPEYVGQYAQEVYVYVHKKEYLGQVRDLLSYEKIRSFVNSISSKKISVMRLYMYLKDNIDGIE